MSEEYYKANLFGEVVDVGLKNDDEEEEVGEKEDRRFNVFLLTDAIGARDKRQAWILYRQAIANGLVAEEIYWRVVWEIKTLLISAKTSAEESGLNPFVYKKAKAFLKNWKIEELEKASRELVVGFHNSRRGQGEIETLIEKFLLRL